MKERFGHALVWVFTLVYASLSAGCFWRERGRDPDVYVERRHVEHDDHEHGDHGHGDHEHEHQQHEDRHDHEKH